MFSKTWFFFTAKHIHVRIHRFCLYQTPIFLIISFLQIYKLTWDFFIFYIVAWHFQKKSYHGNYRFYVFSDFFIEKYVFFFFIAFEKTVNWASGPIVLHLALPVANDLGGATFAGSYPLRIKALVRPHSLGTDR